MSRILIFTEVYARGGGNRYMVDVVNAFDDSYGELVIAGNPGALYPEDEKRLHRPFVWCPVHFVTRSRLGRSIKHWPVPIRNAVTFALMLVEPFLFLYNVLWFSLLLKRLEPTRVLSCNGGYPAASACLAIVVAAGLLRIPVALSVVSVPSRRKLPLRTLFYFYDRLIDWLIARFVDVVIVNAQAIATPLQLRHRIPGSKIAVVPNGLEESLPIVGGGIRADHELVIGCIARMDVAKGVLVLLDAFARLSVLRPQLKLVLAGEGDASIELVRRVKALGLEGRVHLLGHYDGNVDTLIQTFDLYVFPSFWEGLPSSIVEAMRAAASIVTTNVGGIPEAITHEKEGLLVEPNSSDALVYSIERLIEDPGLRKKLAQNARHRYETSFSLGKMQQRVRDVLKIWQFKPKRQHSK